MLSVIFLGFAILVLKICFASPLGYTDCHVCYKVVYAWDLDTMIQ